jgi:hypothetical protein
MPRMYSPRAIPPASGGSVAVPSDIAQGKLLFVNNQWHCMDVLTRRWSDAIAGEDRIACADSMRVSAVRPLDEEELAWVRSRDFDYAVVGMGH